MSEPGANSRFTGGRQSSFAISVFFTCPAWSIDIPFTLSVMYELEAMAEPHPKVLNLTSLMMPGERQRGHGRWAHDLGAHVREIVSFIIGGGWGRKAR